MPERGFATETWDSDDWFQELSRDQRYLFIYLWTNNHCNPAGLYHITLTTIAFGAKFSKEELPELLHSLAPKVKWYPEENLVWVKNFIKRQSKSSKFLAAAAKSLTSIHHNGAIKELLEYNLNRYSISIPYQYYMDRISILTRATASASVSGSSSGADNSLFSASLFSLDEVNEAISKLPKGVDRLVEHEAIKQKLADMGVAKGYRAQSEYPCIKGRVDLCWLNKKGEIVAAFEIDYLTPKDKSVEKLQALGCPNPCIVLRDKAVTIPPSESEIEESLSEGDRKVISIWFSVKGFSMPNEEAAELVARLRTEFTDVDILAESKAWAARKLSEPLKPESRPSAQIWNWMRKAREFAQERRKDEQVKGRRVKAHPREAYRGKW